MCYTVLISGQVLHKVNLRPGAAQCQSQAMCYTVLISGQVLCSVNLLTATLCVSRANHQALKGLPGRRMTHHREVLYCMTLTGVLTYGPIHSVTFSIHVFHLPAQLLLLMRPSMQLTSHDVNVTVNFVHMQLISFLSPYPADTGLNHTPCRPHT